MTTTIPPGIGGEGGTGGSGGGTGTEGDFLAGLMTRRRRSTSTQQDAQTANVPASGAGTGPVVTDNRRRKRNRDTVLTGPTGGSEEPNTYRPSIGGA